MATAKKAAKKPAAKKPAAKKPAAKKPAAKKPAAKKAAPQKSRAEEEARCEEARGQAQAQCGVHEGDDAVGDARLPSSAARRCRAPKSPRRSGTTSRRTSCRTPINRRLINADEKLRAVFGGKGKVSMFEMTKLVSNHLK